MSTNSQIAFNPQGNTVVVAAAPLRRLACRPLPVRSTRAGSTAS
jgi:hypothetical protein